MTISESPMGFTLTHHCGLCVLVRETIWCVRGNGGGWEGGSGTHLFHQLSLKKSIVTRWTKALF